MKKTVRFLSVLLSVMTAFSAMTCAVTAEPSPASEGYKLVSAADSTDGWGALNASAALDNENYVEGTGSVKAVMNEVRDGGGVDFVSSYVGFDTVDISEYPYAEAFIYHSDYSGGNAVQICVVDTATDGWNGYNYTHGADNEKAGWYRLNTEIAQNWHVGGIGNDVNRLRFVWQCYGDYYVGDFNADSVIFFTKAFLDARTEKETAVLALVNAATVPTAENFSAVKADTEKLIADVDVARAEFKNLWLGTDGEAKLALIKNTYDRLSDTTLSDRAIALINAIGTLDKTNYTDKLKSITDAEAAVAAVIEAKGSADAVTNYAVLTAARKTYEELCKQAIENAASQNKVISSADSTDGWGALNGIIKPDKDNFVEGTGSVKAVMNEERDGTGADFISAYIDFDSLDIAEYPYVEAFVYHGAFSGGNAVQICTIDTLTDGWNGYNFTHVANDEAAGWYRFNTGIAENWHVGGIGTDINRVRFVWQCYENYYLNDFCVDNVIFFTKEFLDTRTAQEERVSKLVMEAEIPSEQSIDALSAATKALIAEVNSARGSFPNFYMGTQAEAKFKSIKDAYDVLSGTEYIENCISLIDAIGEITADNYLSKSDAIKKAEEAAKAIIESKGSSDCITNYSVLTAAREKFDAFAREQADNDAAAACIALIDKIPAYDKITLGDKSKVDKASAALAALNDAAARLVDSSYSETLEKAVAKINELLKTAPGYITCDNGDSVYSWSTGCDETLSVDKQNKTEGEGSIKIVMSDEQAIDGTVHMQIYCDFDTVDANYYCYGEFMLYNSLDFNSNSGIHASFSDPNTAARDGFNSMIGVDGRKAGWYRYTYSLLDNWKLDATSADNIGGFRLAWYNYSEYYPMVLYIDNLVLMTKETYLARADEEKRINDLVLSLSVPTADTISSMKEQLAALYNDAIAAAEKYPNFRIEEQTKLEELIAAYLSLAKSDVISTVEEAIRAIGELTQDNYTGKLELITKAEALAADAIANYGDGCINNYSVLTDARAAYNEFAKLDAYNEAARRVIELIDALPDTDKLTLGDKLQVREANDKYEGLLVEIQKLISAEKVQKLNDAMERINYLLNPFTPGNVDMDEDNLITAADALLALQCAVGKKELESAAFSAADVDEDGSVTAADALQILQYSVGKKTAFDKVK